MPSKKQIEKWARDSERLEWVILNQAVVQQEYHECAVFEIQDGFENAKRLGPYKVWSGRQAIDAAMKSSSKDGRKI